MLVHRWVTLALLLATGVASAHPVYLAGDPPEPAEEHRPFVEWATLFRVGYDAHQQPATHGIARSTTSTPSRDVEVGDGWQATVGAELTVPVAANGDIRIGPWIEARGFTNVVAGGELQIARAPRKLDLFFYEGQGVVVVRGGGNREQYTGALAWGYRAPWRLWGPWTGTTRYMIGARIVLTGSRAVHDPANWSVGLGIEVEPIGALRYLLGLKSLYH